MRTRMLFGAAGMAVAAGLLASVPIACSSGGGGGGIGLGIATLGISAIFAGSSPGWNIIDPNFATPIAAPLSGKTITTVTGGAKPEFPTPTADVSSNPSGFMDRVLIAGGEVTSPITIKGSATGTTAGDRLKVTLFFEPWDSLLSGFSGPFVMTETSITINNATTNYTAVLDFSTVENSGAQLVPTASNPGDHFIIEFENTNSGGATIAVNATGTSITYGSNRTRESKVVLAPNSNTDSSHFELIAASNPFSHKFNFWSIASTTATAFSIAPHPGNFTVTTGVNQPTALRVDVLDSNGQGVPGKTVKFEGPTATATPATVTAVTDQDGVASALMTFTSTGTATIKVSTGSLQPTTIDVTIQAAPVRGFDGTSRFLAVDGTPASPTALMQIDLTDILGTGFHSPNQPDTVEYDFARNAASGSEWRFNVFARTISSNSTATATFRINVLDGNGNQIANSGNLTATSGLQQFSGIMTQTNTVEVDFDIANGGAAKDAFDVRITASASTDTVNPGVQIVSDDLATSTVSFPGPVVFKTNGTGSTAATKLGSSPDPRQ